MKKFHRTLGVILICALLAAVSAGCGGGSSTPPDGGTAPAAGGEGPGKSTVSWAIATSSSGSSPYKLGTNIANVLSSNQSDVVLSAQSTAGFNENLFLVADGEVPIGMITGLDLMNAYNQQESYAGNPQFTKLRRMFIYSVEYGHQFVRADSDIKEFTDIKGKKFNMNTPASITSIRNNHLLSAFGMSRDDVEVVEIATSGAFDAIRDNIANMSANGLSIGNASLLELSSSIPIRLIGIPEDAFLKFKELMANTVDYGVIPAGTYNGQDEDCWTWVGYNLLFTSEDVDEDLIYEITKAYWENLSELQEMDSGFKLVTTAMATYGPQDVPLHPGVERYLKEAGLM